MDEKHIEELARQMCKDAGVDPDADVVRGPLLKVKDDFGIVCSQSQKAWTLWMPEADVAAKYYSKSIQMALDAGLFASFPGSPVQVNKSIS